MSGRYGYAGKRPQRAAERAMRAYAYEVGRSIQRMAGGSAS